LPTPLPRATPAAGEDWWRRDQHLMELDAADLETPATPAAPKAP